MDTRFVKNPKQSAADDAEIERIISAYTDDERASLASFAAAWDVENADGREEEENRRALVRPAFPWPLLAIAAVSVAVLLLAWGV